MMRRGRPGSPARWTAAAINRAVRGTQVLFVCSLFAPYSAYFLAEHAGASGVIAVVIADRRGRGPFRGRHRGRADPLRPSRPASTLLDVDTAAEALDRDPRIPVADHERAALPRAVIPGAGSAPSVDQRGGELGVDASAEALDVEAGGGALGQAQPDGTTVALDFDARSLRQRGIELDLARHGPEFGAFDLVALHADAGRRARRKAKGPGPS